MPDRRLPDAATEGATTVDTTPEHDDGKPKPNAGLDRRQDRNSALAEQAQGNPSGLSDSAKTDPESR